MKLFILVTILLAITIVAAEDSECWKYTYGRGAGTPVHTCNKDGYEKDGLLCYPKCRDGYEGKGPVCWYVGKESYGRGIGSIFKKKHMEKSGGLWYHKCRDGFKGVGPVCWSKNSLSYGRTAGLPMGCSSSETE